MLITGEIGTGKEMVARALHMASPRSHLPIVGVNCSALPEAPIEAELFGYIKELLQGPCCKGLGDSSERIAAPCFLVEVGGLPLGAQAKLLRALREQELERWEVPRLFALDVRVIAATNSNLAEQVRSGRFREDLYYRLNVADPDPVAP